MAKGSTIQRQADSLAGSSTDDPQKRGKGETNDGITIVMPKLKAKSKAVPKKEDRSTDARSSTATSSGNPDVDFDPLGITDPQLESMFGKNKRNFITYWNPEKHSTGDLNDDNRKMVSEREVRPG